MGEEDTVFSSKISYKGIFSFKEFYAFCYNWLTEETGLDDFSEDKYSEKLAGDTKDIDIEWTASRNFSDYFKFKMKIAFTIRALSQVKIKKEGVETDSNKGSVEVKVKGILVKDYQGKFDISGFRKFLRSIYEKYVIPATVKDLKGKIAADSNEFLEQAKAYLDLEGRKG
ncbi:MAG: hypothetical protein KGH55_02675 [Nanoarchaeota archaeon]|nr:hypothetical protein [Nanoarchaeota archaeon]